LLCFSRVSFCQWCEIVPLMRFVLRLSAVSAIPERLRVQAVNATPA